MHYLLAIEDNELDRQILKIAWDQLKIQDTSLSIYSHSVVLFKKIKELLENSVDSITLLIDLSLPEKSGFEISRQAKDMCLRIHNVAYTHSVYENDIEKAYESCFDDYVIKPSSLEETKKTLKKISKIQKMKGGRAE